MMRKRACGRDKLQDVTSLEQEMPSGGGPNEESRVRYSTEGRLSLRALFGLAILSLAACASDPPPMAVAPYLPPASMNQIEILDREKSVLPFPTVTDPEYWEKLTPCVVDLQAALRVTPEGQELRRAGYSQNRAEYHFLLHRANERVISALRRVASRRGLSPVMQIGSIVLKGAASNVGLVDITEDVLGEVSR